MKALALEGEMQKARRNGPTNDSTSDGSPRTGLALGTIASLLSLATLMACGSACGGSPRSPGGESAQGPAGEAEPSSDPRSGAPAGAGEGSDQGSGEAPIVDAPAAPAAPQPPFLVAPAGSLDAFYAGLLAAQAATDDGSGRVLISLFGDSHTAGDRMTGRLRQVLGERFGDAGRGFVAAGKPPIRHYYQTELRYGSLGKWKATVGGQKEGEEPFGMGGLRASTRDRRGRSWVESCVDCGLYGRAGRSGHVSRFEIFFWMHPNGAKLRYRVDDQKWQSVSTALKKGGPFPARTIIQVPDGPHRLTVELGGTGTLSLFGIALERDRPGVIVDGLGVVGRTLLQLAAWDWNVISAQLTERAPRLVVLQYGTNEADHKDLDLPALANRYDQVIARIRAAVPNAAVLLLGPPDMAVRQDGKACDDPRRGVPPFRAPVPLAPVPPSSPIATPPAAPGEASAPGEPVLAPVIDPVTGVAVDPAVDFVDRACQWRTPPRLLEVVAVQREAARRNGVAFFDSLSALGGPESIDGLAGAVPPLAAKDRIHLTQPGYARWADLLLAELLAGFEAYAQSAAPAASSFAAPSLEN